VDECTISNEAFKYFTCPKCLSDIIILFPITSIAKRSHHPSHQDFCHSTHPQAQTPSFHFTLLHSSTPRAIQTSHSSRSDITTCSLRWYFGCIGRIPQTHILERNIETWMNVTTTYARSPIPLSSLRISREIHECYIGDFHQRRPRIGTVVT